MTGRNRTCAKNAQVALTGAAQMTMTAVNLGALLLAGFAAYGLNIRGTELALLLFFTSMGAMMGVMTWGKE